MFRVICTRAVRIWVSRLGKPRARIRPVRRAVGRRGLPPEADGLEPGQIDEKQQAGHHLADDRGDAGTNHPHAQREDEDGIQNQVEGRAGDHAAHAVPGMAVRPDDGGEGGADQLEGQPQAMVRR